MTILVSGTFLSCERFLFGDRANLVLQDTFSSKCKSAVHGGIFENVVKKYRQRTKNQNKKAKRGITESLIIPVGVSSSDIEESSARAQQNVDRLPGQVLEQVRVVHQYTPVISFGPNRDLHLTLDDINRARELDEKVKAEILHDKDARSVSIDHPPPFL